MMLLTVPSPAQSSTPTETTRAYLATPKVLAATVPAQWVPWLSQPPGTRLLTLRIREHEAGAQRNAEWRQVF